MTFDACLKEVLKHEGLYSDHPADPGGRTMRGVTQRVWERWTGRRSSEAEMRSLSVMDVAPLYRAQYWDELRCDNLPGPLALCVFDFGVNAGPGRAAKMLQAMVGATQDGRIGAKTLAAVQQYATARGLAECVRQYQQSRRSYYRRLRSFPTFGRGWLRRVDDVESAALRMLQGKQEKVL